MLTNLHVKNFAIIDEADLDFGKGFNVLSGETGAGKSLLIGSITAALGGKMNKDMMGAYADFALAEITFETQSENVKRILEKNDLIFDDGQVVISRRITSAGRSVSRINGESVSAAVLKEVAAELIDIHGQHEHQSLLYKSGQRNILDSSSEDILDALNKVKLAYSEFRKAEKTLNEELNRDRRTPEEMHLLFHEANEIEMAELVVGEDVTLEERYKSLSNSDKILEELSRVKQSLSGNVDVSDAVDQAVRDLSKISDMDAGIAECENDLSMISEQLSDVNVKLGVLAEKYSGTEEEYAEVSERLNLINRFKSRYGNTIEEILAYAENVRNYEMKMFDFDKYIESLRSQVEEKEKALEAANKDLSTARRVAAEDLEKKINEALCDLNFEHAQFEIRFEKLDRHTEYGDEEIEFYLSANLGEPLKKLAQCASGGELSRVMLAIKSAAASAGGTESLIFDEIDTGISGRTAQKVAEKIALISKDHQVICITHLPQLAAMADKHYLISKKEQNGRTRTDINPLSREEMTEELARMLSGAELTDSVRENAREMKELADKVKAKLS